METKRWRTYKQLESKSMKEVVVPLRAQKGVSNTDEQRDECIVTVNKMLRFSCFVFE